MTTATKYPDRIFVRPAVGVAAVIGIAVAAQLAWTGRDGQLQSVGLVALLVIGTVSVAVLGQTGAVWSAGGIAGVAAIHVSSGAVGPRVVMVQTAAVIAAGAVGAILMNRRARHHVQELGDDVALELQAITSGGLVLDVNQSLVALLGYERAELVGRDIAELIHPDDRHRSLVDRLLLLDAHVIENRFARMICADGGLRVVCWSASRSERDGLTRMTGRDASQEVAESMAIRVTRPTDFRSSYPAWSRTTSPS